MGKNINLGGYLKLARRINKMTLRDAESKTGISNAAISQIETGKINMPSFENVLKLCRCYGLDISEAADFIDLPDVREKP